MPHVERVLRVRFIGPIWQPGVHAASTLTIDAREADRCGLDVEDVEDVEGYLATYTTVRAWEDEESECIWSDRMFGSLDE